ncbi:hypothetical protein KC901_02375 [Patescibacteria group bacterium]|nr:hypothetical protein [Patescibacteria group bacterium]
MEPNQEKQPTQNFEELKNTQENPEIKNLQTIKEGLEGIEELYNNHILVTEQIASNNNLDQTQHDTISKILASGNERAQSMLDEAKAKFKELYEKLNKGRVGVALGVGLAATTPNLQAQETKPHNTQPEKTEVMKENTVNENTEDTISIETIKNYELAKERALEEKNAKVKALEFDISLADTPEEEYIASELQKNIEQEREQITSPDFTIPDVEELELVESIAKSLEKNRNEILSELQSLYEKENIQNINEVDKELLSQFKQISKIKWIENIFNNGGAVGDGFNSFELSFPELPSKEEMSNPNVIEDYFTRMQETISSADQKIKEHILYMQSNPDEFIDTTMTEKFIRAGWNNVHRDREENLKKLEALKTEIENIQNTTIKEYLKNGSSFSTEKNEE